MNTSPVDKKKDDKPTFSIRISYELKERLRHIAKLQKRSLNAQIELMLEHGADQLERDGIGEDN